MRIDTINPADSEGWSNSNFTQRLITRYFIYPLYMYVLSGLNVLRLLHSWNSCVNKQNNVRIKKRYMRFCIVIECVTMTIVSSLKMLRHPLQLIQSLILNIFRSDSVIVNIIIVTKIYQCTKARLNHAFFLLVRMKEFLRFYVFSARKSFLFHGTKKTKNTCTYICNICIGISESRVAGRQPDLEHPQLAGV